MGQSGFWAMVEIGALVGGPLLGVIFVGAVGFGAGAVIVAYPAASAAALGSIAVKRLVCGERVIANYPEEVVLTVAAAGATTIAAGPLATMGAATACSILGGIKESYDQQQEKSRTAASQEPVVFAGRVDEPQDPDDFVLITK